MRQQLSGTNSCRGERERGEREGGGREGGGREEGGRREGGREREGDAKARWQVNPHFKNIDE